MTEKEVLDEILAREGGFINHPADKGGATNWGITIETLSEWRKKPAGVNDVMHLTRAEAREIYRAQYIERPGFLGIENEKVRSLVIDCAVNHGVTRAIKLLQQAAHVFADGILGPKSLAAVNRMTPAALYRRLCAERVRLYGRIITKDPSQAVFAAGWCNRVAEFIEESP